MVSGLVKGIFVGGLTAPINSGLVVIMVRRDRGVNAPE